MTAGTRADDVRPLDRIRRWYRDRFGITEAEAGLEHTRQLAASVHRELDATVRQVRQARMRLGRHDWPERYAERLNDRVGS